MIKSSGSVSQKLQFPTSILNHCFNKSLVGYILFIILNCISFIFGRTGNFKSIYYAYDPDDRSDGHVTRNVQSERLHSDSD